MKQETAHIILKKLLNMLQDLDLQNPIALKTISQGSESKFCKIYVSNTIIVFTIYQQQVQQVSLMKMMKMAAL